MAREARVGDVDIDAVPGQDAGGCEEAEDVGELEWGAQEAEAGEDADGDY